MPSRSNRSQALAKALSGIEDEDELALILAILGRAKLTMWAADGPENDFAICLWSPGAERTYGYSRAEAIGANYIDLIVNPSERQQAIDDHIRMVAEDEEYEWDWAADDVAKDGRVHTMLTNCFPVIDHRRDRQVLAELGVDISKKEQASAKLRKLQAESVMKEAKASNMRWMAAVDSLYSSAGRLASADADVGGTASRAAAVAVRRIVEGNPAVRVWLTSPAGGVLADGSDELAWHPVIDEQAALAMLESANAPEAMFVDSHDRNTRLVAQRRRGKGRAAGVIPIMFGLQLRGMLALHFRDERRISESERSALAHIGMHVGVALAMEEQWRELQRWRESESARIQVQAVQRFLRLVFHRVGGSAYVVSEELQKLEETLEAQGAESDVMSRVRRIRDRSARIEAALEEFRNERDHVHELRPLSLRALCLAKTIDMEHTFPTVEVELEVSDDLYVQTSEFLVAEALSNLITNAAEEVIESGDGGGIIRLQASLDPEDRIALSVEDSGRGVPDDQRDEIWRRGRSTKGGGHGYGLAYAREAVELAGGDLALSEETSSLGGARFVVHLMRAVTGPSS